MDNFLSHFIEINHESDNIITNRKLNVGLYNSLKKLLMRSSANSMY